MSSYSPALVNNNNLNLNISASVVTTIEFKIFSKLPSELRLKIWGHALPDPRIIEIQISQYCSGWQLATESKPKMPAIHAVNKEARYELLRWYKPVSLNKSSINLSLLPNPGLCRFFFSPAKDTVYITEIFNGPRSYTEAALWFLRHDFLTSVRHLAIQGEILTCDEFDRLPPYNLITLATLTTAKILERFVTKFSQLETLRVVVGDDFSLAPKFLAAISDFTSKPVGELELTGLTRGRQATDEYCSAEDQVLGWIRFLFDHFPETLNEPEVALCQAMRGGKLAMVGVLGLLETRD